MRHQTMNTPEPHTDAQMRAIDSMGARAFSRPSRDEDLRKMLGKPKEELTKAEAGAAINKLEGILSRYENRRL